MEYGEKFRKSLFGGFDRQDVLRCMEELQRQNHEEQEKLRLELESLRQERDALRRQTGEQEMLLKEQAETVSRIEESVLSMTSALEQAEERCETLQRDLSAQKAVSSELLMKKNVLEENCRRLAARVQGLEAKSTEEATLALGELMVEAKVNAARIEEEARQRAARADEVLAGKCAETDRQIAAVEDRVSTVIDSLKAFCDAALADMHRLTGQLEECREAVRETSPAGREVPAEEEAAPQPAAPVGSFQEYPPRKGEKTDPGAVL